MLVLLLVDDHPVYLEGLRALLGQRLRQAQILGADSGRAALALLQQQPGIDLLITDQHLPDRPGLDLLAEAGRRWPLVARVLMSGQDDPRLPLQARTAGAAGFLHKAMPPAQLLQALQVLLGGGEWFAPVPLPAPPAWLPPLPPRAREALALLERGLNNRQIAQHMGIGERAVKQHLSAAYAALGVHSRAQAIVRLGRPGQVDDNAAGSAP